MPTVKTPKFIQALKSAKPPPRRRRSLPKIKAVVSQTCALVGEGNNARVDGTGQRVLYPHARAMSYHSKMQPTDMTKQVQ